MWRRLNGEHDDKAEAMTDPRANDKRLLDVWLRFLYTFALSDHLGDASESVRSMGELLSLPVPPDDADLDQWCEWVKTEYGVDESTHALIIRERDGGTEQPKPAPTLQQRLDAFLATQGF
jgi:hypothetical protein